MNESRKAAGDGRATTGHRCRSAGVGRPLRGRPPDVVGHHVRGPLPAGLVDAAGRGLRRRRGRRRGGRHRGRRRLQGLGGPRPGRSWSLPATPSRPDRRTGARHRRGRVRGHGYAPREPPQPGHRTRRPQLPGLCGPGRTARGAVLVFQRHGQPGPAAPGRTGGGHHPVERPVHAGHLEGGTGTGRRQPGRPQARRVVTALGQPPGRPGRRGRPAARRAQRGAGHRFRRGPAPDV